ncbi:MAG TPA: methyltransferase domain-containing protein, partial [Chitinophagaceae bacterium]|nr:methyltransferase domain-containing protein [Chitinophagaceae bacterium]
MEVFSPLTGTNDVTELDKFDVSKIVSVYQNELNLDVSRYFQGLDHILLYKCNATGYRFYFPFFIEADSFFYEQLMLTKKSYYPAWKWENQMASRFIKETDKILDVGCGDGAFLSGILKRMNVSAEGLEFNPVAIKKATESGLSVFPETVQNYSLVKKQQYDVVTSFQVVEHIVQLKSFLSGKLDLLKPGGVMIIAVPY